MEQVASWGRNSKITTTISSLQSFYKPKSKYLLALHSCSESFGIAVKDIDNQEIIKSEVFNTGRSLSNKLFSCIEKVLPRKFWKQIIRISIAKGPGSFTSTRITISMARAIAQQINCSLDSMSSFHLMAPRLYKNISQNQDHYNPFWIKDILPRRGIVAGKYKLIKIHNKSNFHEFNEIIKPQLIKNEKEIHPSINASENIEKDIISLIQYSQFCQNSKLSLHWKDTLPIYPTSPIDNKNL